MKFIYSLSLIFSLSFFAFGQRQKDLSTAAERVNKSSGVINHFTNLGADSVPVEYLRKAKAIAVFPEITKVNILLNELFTGNGIVSVRRSGGDDGGGWSVPAFLAFKGSGVNLSFAGKKSFDAVVLFMDDESIGWLKKGDINFSSGKKVIALGPVIGGAETDKTSKNANLIYYTFRDGQLIDVDLRNDSFLKAFGIAHDNNMNKAIFGMKTKTLFETPESSVKVPAEIDRFRTAIIEALSPPPPPPQQQQQPAPELNSEKANKNR